MLENSEILDFVKALANADRLKIVGMLSQNPARLSEIVSGLSLPTREVFDHLTFLEHVGVIHIAGDLYELDMNGLEVLSRHQFQGGRPSFIGQPGLEPQSQKILGTFLNADGTIRQMPNSRTQALKFHIVLEYLIAAFDPGVFYSEKEVNNILRRFNEDVAGLRRDLIDAKMLARERNGSKYWRLESDEGQK
jgi:hypothetical protein